MSGKPKIAEGPRETNQIAEELAGRHRVPGCLRNAMLMIAILALWLGANIFFPVGAPADPGPQGTSTPLSSLLQPPSPTPLATPNSQ